ncbi:Lrp/AsnC family transcriptional regulator, partial [Candidatus Woesearchaeota archaeon]|nr:Lrp/AsnC family transcriptional regulator [Candidatus Woesearchaeota archaeon]
EEDVRQTLSQVAKKLKTSQQVVSYRLQSLQKRNIIAGFYSMIDFTRLGYTSYRTMIRLSNFTPQIHEEFINYLMKKSNIFWLVDCGGRWDLLVNILARNIIHYNEILGDIKNSFPEHIQNFDILTTVEVTYFGRDYLTNPTNIRSGIHIGKLDEVLNPDKKDLQILNLLSNNARMSSVEVAQKLKISPNTAMFRIKNMKKSGLLLGFKPLIHLDKLDYTNYKALIKLQNITEKKEKQIINYLKSNANVVVIIKLIGSWDFEIEFEFKTKEDMLLFTRAVRDQFKDVIKEFETVTIYHEYKINYFPDDLLSQKQ